MRRKNPQPNCSEWKPTRAWQALSFTAGAHEPVENDEGFLFFFLFCGNAFFFFFLLSGSGMKVPVKLCFSPVASIWRFLRTCYFWNHPVHVFFFFSTEKANEMKFELKGLPRLVLMKAEVMCGCAGDGLSGPDACLLACLIHSNHTLCHHLFKHPHLTPYSCASLFRAINL